MNLLSVVSLLFTSWTPLYVVGSLGVEESLKLGLVRGDPLFGYLTSQELALFHPEGALSWVELTCA